MQYRVPVLILLVAALAGVLLLSRSGRAPTEAASVLPPAVQRTPPPPANVPPSVPTRPPE